MCGIAGELRLDDQRPDPAVIQKMTATLARRGPDAEGTWFDGPVAFGHRRLAIIDLSLASAQPMVDEAAGLALIFNGTIYNYPGLRAELIGKGHRFKSDGDTEVLLRAWAEWGEDCVEHLDGAFAFALWDRSRGRLFLARDRLGIKPLYYNLTGAYLRFASTTQALLAAGGVDTAIDPVALHHHFTLHAVVPAPYTLLAGVRKVAPATTLSFDRAGQMTERRYWRLAAQRPERAMTEAEWQAAIHDALSVAVQKRLAVADVKVGVLLSGGLDSSLLVALLAEQGARDLMTFSVGFEDQPEEAGNEFEYSDAVAAHFGTRHHQYRIANGEVLRRLPEAVDNMAEPMVGQDAVAFYLLAEQVSKTVKVVQSGQGADEVFGGYFWYPQMRAETEGAAVERFRRHYFDRDHAEYLTTVMPVYHGPDHTAATVAARLAEPLADEFIDQVLRLDATLLITDDPVKRVDNMTMAWGLEARVPFLDRQVVELAARMPPELKLASGGKHILKLIARGRLPDAVIDRKKGYFPMPALKYVRGDFLEFMRAILDSRACRERGLFRRDYVAKLLAEPERHHTRIQGSKLWHLALLELWLQRNVDGV
ncbi:MAG: N-acetylglutaminylglutamine amidotransferase [Hydrogenophilales bacterium CG03_land_8_20_14_0_80_62_28]|nr:N-acetylglutaminylglutamine amidotransferase [Betaproteobacteria bacterium]OIO77034.1 MAG: asparagine synthase (glutamine-hydrolyzing) [Hydrogenophilaceae bacterium CG1_02_62_390]PIV22635.1 MAG: N-acetylglutaminylglutamine amidotransferase [Hydrogenophilales bacterium CG03_land_8_20_14_0_80_62_28]PIW38348.1 MAG: N-acetylglutaminylglutamine amidotransferase [Hydrogenophilales bacterium CG15_BIG_FIL_POST_REV_8_21_14_020_62_31]PIW71912.1 MAG: N-acetylglutaminylglutamine amidotransferase [Hydrog